VALTAWCGPDLRLVTIDCGPYEITAVRSSHHHDETQLRAATRQLLAAAMDLGVAGGLWRSTAIGHWVRLQPAILLHWLEPPGASPDTATAQPPKAP
jgi:hypothetical protein